MWLLELKLDVYIKSYTLSFIAAFIIIGGKMEAAHMSIDWGMDE